MFYDDIIANCLRNEKCHRGKSDEKLRSVFNKTSKFSDKRLRSGTGFRPTARHAVRPSQYNCPASCYLPLLVLALLTPMTDVRETRASYLFTRETCTCVVRETCKTKCPTTRTTSLQLLLYFSSVYSFTI